MRRATGRGGAAGFVPLTAAAEEAAKPTEEMTISACEALRRDALKGNRLVSIWGKTPLKTSSTVAEEASPLTLFELVGPAVNCWQV